MKTDPILVFDAGSSSLKATLFSADGQILDRDEVAYRRGSQPHRLDPEAWWEAAVEAVSHLPPLQLDPALCRVAAERCQDMVDRHYFAHTDPDGHDPFWHLAHAGVNYRTAGENIAEGQRSPDEVMRTWMGSAGHRANILKASHARIGIGVAQGRDGLVWTQVFTG